MKKFFSFLFLFFCVSLYAQDQITPISYSEVVSVENAAATDLFVRGRAWFAKSYNNSKAVLQMAENNVLVGKAMHESYVYAGFSSSTNVKITYDITVECRNNRYKYTIDNIVAKPEVLGFGEFGVLTTAAEIAVKGMGKKQRNKVWQATKIEFDNYAYTLIESLLSAMITGTRDTSGDNW